MIGSVASVFIGSAGWNIPRMHREQFAQDGSQLERYAARLNAAEINTSFYRPHAVATYARWAASVPPSFRFAVKIPKLITHDRALTRAREPLVRFLDEIAGLGQTLGPLLVQLPPSFEFELRRVGRFFDLLRGLHPGNVVCEPRHPTWTMPAATRLLESFRVGGVAAVRHECPASTFRAAGRPSSTTGGMGRRGRTSRRTRAPISIAWRRRSTRTPWRRGASSTTRGPDPRPATRSTSPRGLRAANRFPMPLRGRAIKANPQERAGARKPFVEAAFEDVE